MKYYIFRLSFPNGAHFGDGNLDSYNMTFHADTLFSALFIEAVKSGGAMADRLLRAAREGKLVLSDGFPYIEDTYYLPKPMLYIERNEDIGNSVLKETAKKLIYIPMDKMDGYLEGTMDLKQESDKFSRFGTHQIKESVAIYGLEETEPYYVGIYTYGENNGLYFFAGLDEEIETDLIDLLDMLSFSGLGGKRSAGLGRFEVARMVEVPAKHFEGESDGRGYLLLASSLPKEEEMDKVLDQASYLLEKRSGFVQSTGSFEERKKADQYFLQAGSCLQNRFEGDIYEVGVGMSHPVYRYGKPLFWKL